MAMHLAMHLIAFVPNSVIPGTKSPRILIDYVVYCLCSAVCLWLPSDSGNLPSAANIFLGIAMIHFYQNHGDGSGKARQRS